MAASSVLLQRVPAASLTAEVPTVPPFDGEDSLDVAKEAAKFLADFSKVIEDGDWDKFGNFFSEACWWRDSLTLTFDKRTLKGRESIVKAWRTLAPARKPSGFHADKDSIWDMSAEFTRLAPVLAHLDVPFGFSTDSPKSKCVGLIRLIPENGQWKIWILHTAIQHLDNHPFQPLPRRTPSSVDASHRGQVSPQGLPQLDDKVLDVVVIGGSSSGLADAIMLDSAGADVAIFDMELTVGGLWSTKRYKGVTLHHPNLMIQLPFFPVPEDFPPYLEGSHIAQYYSMAVEQLKLPYFGGIKVVSNKWDAATGLWTIQLEDVVSGTQGSVKAKNVIMATGYVLGSNPYFPKIADREKFTGPVQHSAEFRDSDPYLNKDVVIVGCGTSAHDIARSLALDGVKSVTMLQRSPSTLLDYNIIAPMVTAKYQGSMPVEAADFLETAIPVPVTRLMAIGGLQMMIQAMGGKNKLLEGKGYMIDYAPDMISQAFEQRGRAMYMDHLKTFDLVLNDQIRVASGEARAYTESGVLVHDKSTGQDRILPADGVVLATGFENIDVPKMWADNGLFEPEVAEKLCNVNHLGVNAEGEFPGFVTFSGHPHLFFGGLGPYLNRWIARYVAVQVVADVRGEFPQRYQG